jgi:Rho termination factor, N-terminal domain
MPRVNIQQYFNIHKEYVTRIQKFSGISKLKIRLPNFPEVLSENLVKFYIQSFENRECINSKNGGDLEAYNNKIEVKCFTSSGPTSFGPKESWSELYFLDAVNIFSTEIVKIYKCNLSNDSSIWQNLKINKDETFEDKCRKGQRPRINFSKLYDLLSDHIKVVFDGSVDSLLFSPFKKTEQFLKIPEMNNNLKDKSRKDLLDIARQLKLRKYSKLRKKELAELITASHTK